jgi:hypothetical protein
MRRGLIGVVFAALLVLLVADNLYRFVALRRDRSCDDTLCVRPDRLAELAAENRHPEIHGRVALYHRLAERIAGATLTIPPWLEEHRWSFERVARLRVVVAAAPMLVDPGRVDELRAAATLEHRWLRTSHRRGRHVWQPLHLELDGRGDYVLAESGTPDPELFLVPAARYREAAAR